MTSSSEGPPRVLAVDYGARRTGLAATDWTGRVPVPLGAITADDPGKCADQVARIARERESQVIVVGLPLDRRGAIGPRARQTLRFVEALRARADCPVATHDETFSTDEAHARLRAAGLKAAARKKVADSVAALVILERYLAGLSMRRSGGPEGPS